MVGNDLIDLETSYFGSDARKNRYLMKICTQQEIDRLDHLQWDEQNVWLLWSIKESVYKIIARVESRVRFAPKTIICTQIVRQGDGTYLSEIKYQDLTFYCHSVVYEKLIHSVSVNEKSNLQNVVYDYTDHSTKTLDKDNMNNALINLLAKSFPHKAIHMRITRDDLRIPHLYYKNEELGWFSISHHGNYVGYVLLMHTRELLHKIAL